MKSISGYINQLERDGLLPVAILGLALIIAFFVVYCLILFSLQKLLEQVTPAERKLKPGLTWLMLLPYFNIVWVFIMTARIADSVAAEIKRRGLKIFEARPGHVLGLIWGFISLVGFLMGFAEEPVLSGVLIGLQVICVMVYGIKMNGIRKDLENAVKKEPAPEHTMPSYYPPPPQQTQQSPYAYEPPQYPNDHSRWAPKPTEDKR